MKISIQPIMYSMTAAAMSSLSVPAFAQDYVQFGTGVDYSSGDYGEDVDTKMLAIPFSAKVQTGAVSFRASIPYLFIEGPDGVIPGDYGPVVGGGGDTVSERSGIGDLSLAATYTLPVGNRTWFDATGKVKLPTADEEKFLGTGTTDFTVEGELLHSFGAVAATARAGRRFNGDSDLYDLQDVWQLGAGIYYTTGATTLGLDYDWREASFATAKDRSEVMGSITHNLGGGLRLQGYAYTGFNDASPDLGGGLQVLYRLGE